jgi:hypothetical protein
VHALGPWLRAIMPREKFYLFVVEDGIERYTYEGLTLDDLQNMVGNRTGECKLDLTFRYFPNPVFLIANDDDFANTDWPVVAVINKVEFQGAIVILAERRVDPNGPPEETFLDGLTATECREALRYIKPPPGFPPLRYFEM